ncbi:MAG: LEPR-XLL domain-containing protein [Planctomycetota bacterium]|nr:LEPR-XLL domain-containing protein [Planctomycetota bacterium]
MVTQTRLASEAVVFEGLEPRVLLSGNVVATVAHGAVSIIGDDASNVVEVTVLANGMVGVAGLDGTLVNGLAAPAYVTGNSGDILIDLKGGDNAVTITGGVTDALIFGNLSIKTGRGNDVVGVAGLTVVGNVIISTGQGSDTVSLGSIVRGSGGQYPPGAGTFLEGAVTVKTGAGDDTVALGVVRSSHDPGGKKQPGYGPLHFGPYVNINLGGGDDTLLGEDVDFGGATGTIDGGGGDNTDGLYGPSGNVQLRNFPEGV